MALNRPNKDPDELLDYSVDWSRFLGSDTISAVTWYVYDEDDVKTQMSDGTVVNGLQFIQGTVSGQVATARFGLGTNNVRYTVVCRVDTGDGLRYERSIFLRVKEK